MANGSTQSILVVGGGMSGLTAAVEAAEAGYEVYLVEKNSYLGGRVAQFNQYFPKMCPPYCGLEINFRRIKNNPKIHFCTMAEIESISGQPGSFDVKIKLNPRFVDVDKCTACGECAKATTQEIDNPFDYGMSKTKAIYLPHELAYPMAFVMDPSLAASPEAEKVKEACPFDAIDPSMETKTVDLTVGAVVLATGWKPYDITKLDTYGSGKFANVVSNVQFERIAAKNGPNEGKILRPSDGKEPKNIAFVQCAGSRDQNHLPFCSGICCLASMKQATYIRSQYPDAKITIYFIDIRATDRLEKLYKAAKEDENLTFFKGKVAQIEQDDDTMDLKLRVEDTTTQKLHEVTADLVVLATGMQPTMSENPVPVQVELDEYGFVKALETTPGVIGCGTARTPVGVSESVQDGTAAALKAIQSVRR